MMSFHCHYDLLLVICDIFVVAFVDGAFPGFGVSWRSIKVSGVIRVLVRVYLDLAQYQRGREFWIVVEAPSRLIPVYASTCKRQ
jgi:hypothetical protein